MSMLRVAGKQISHTNPGYVANLQKAEKPKGRKRICCCGYFYMQKCANGDGTQSPATVVGNASKNHNDKTR